MISLKAHFDGRVLVPEEPVDLPLHRTLEIHVEGPATETNGIQTSAVSPLAALVEIGRTFPDDPDTPADLAAQHDHYLHGAPKRP